MNFMEPEVSLPYLQIQPLLLAMRPFSPLYTSYLTSMRISHSLINFRGDSSAKYAVIRDISMSIGSRVLGDDISVKTAILRYDFMSKI
jgi:hypothetical protein